jgi:O-antigen/teichoic acid export membrane protein
MRFATAAATVVIARTLGADRYGVYATAFAFVSLGAVFTDPGLNQVVLRAGARGVRVLPTLLGNALAVKTILLGAVYGILLAISLAIGHAPDVRLTVGILGVGLLLLSAHQVPYALFASLERMHIMAAFQVAVAAITLGGVTTVALFGGGLFPMASVQIAAGLLPLPLLLWFTWRLCRPHVDRTQIGGLLREGMPFAAGGILYFVNAQIDLVLMGIMLASSAIGHYAAANRLVAVLYVLPSIVSWAIIPRLFRHGVEDPVKHGVASGTVLRYLSAFGMVVSAGLFIAAGPVIRLLFGDGFSDSADLLRILCWFLAMQCVSFPLGDALTTSDNHIARVAVAAVAAVVNLVANLWAIPRWGPAAAAYVRLASEALLLLGLGALVVRRLPTYPILSSLRAQLLAVPLGLAAAWVVLDGEHAQTWPQAFVGSAAFVVVAALGLVVFGFVRTPEKELLRRLVSVRGRRR